MTRDEMYAIGSALMDELVGLNIGQMGDVHKAIREHTAELDRDDLITVLGNLLGDALDIGSILAVALGRHPEAEVDALKLRESLEFARITSRLLNGDQ